MKALILLLFAVTLAGCVGYQPDKRVVGVFRAPAGEALDIKADGRIVYVAGGKEEFVGLVTIEQESPLSIRVFAPDTSPLVGTKIVFTEDRTQASVEWQDAKRSGSERPRTFQKKEADPDRQRTTRGM
jgi:hypothetical protein